MIVYGSVKTLKRPSVTTTASVCKPTTQATWALLFSPHVAYVVGLQTNDVRRN